MRDVGRSGGASAILLSLLLTSSAADAQVGDEGDPIESSAYSVDLYAGAVQGTARMVGLGGAFVAILDGIDGNLVSPATPALRPGYSVDHFDYWLGFALMAPFSVGDAFNTGGLSSEAGFDQSGFTYFAPAINLQFGRFGVGLTVEFETANVSSTGEAATGLDETRFRFRFLEVRLQFAYQFFEGQLLLGVGGILVGQRMVGGPSILEEETLYDSFGPALEGGVLYRPNNEQYRLGLSFESAIDTADVSGEGEDVIAGGLYLPRGVYNPWELRLGAAYQFGDRPFNRVWKNVDQVVQEEVGDLWASMSEEEQRLYRKETWRRLRREHRSLSRRYLLTTAALHVIGPTRGAVSVESFLAQTVQRSGEDVSFSVRWGVEADLIPDWLKLRYGNYVEPSRVAQTDPRFHYTFGFDVKMGWWNVFGIWPEDYLWRLAFAMDVARDYLVGSIAIGGWY